VRGASKALLGIAAEEAWSALGAAEAHALEGVAHAAAVAEAGADS
jgi:hypothetical protein